MSDCNFCSWGARKRVLEERGHKVKLKTIPSGDLRGWKVGVIIYPDGHEQECSAFYMEVYEHCTC